MGCRRSHRAGRKLHAGGTSFHAAMPCACSCCCSPPPPHTQLPYPLLGDGGAQVALLAVPVHDVERVAVVQPVLLVRHDEGVLQPRHLPAHTTTPHVCAL